jgi:large subunit ribosomal protein L17
MRHARSGKKLGRDSAHRKALYSNLTGALITHGRIETTEAKAKAVKPFAEKMITLGKRGDLHARRLAMAELRSNDVVHKLFSDVAPRFAERSGGYTRVVKLGPRQGDAAQMALLELVDFEAAGELESEGHELAQRWIGGGSLREAGGSLSWCGRRAGALASQVPSSSHSIASTSSTRPSIAVTTTSRPGSTSVGARASHTSPSSLTWPPGERARTTTALRPTRVPAPTTARRRFDHRTKNAVSATSIAPAAIIAIQPHGAGRTVSARTTATIVSTDVA